MVDHSQVRKLEIVKQGERRPFKPKPWSHQNDLTALKGKTVRLQTELGEFEGKLIEADQFAVKIEYNFGGVIDPVDLGEMTFFKHAIFSFERL